LRAPTQHLRSTQYMPHPQTNSCDMEKYMQDTRMNSTKVARGAWYSDFATTSLKPARLAGSRGGVQTPDITPITRDGISKKQSKGKHSAFESDSEESDDELAFTTSSQTTTKEDVKKLYSHLSQNKKHESNKKPKVITQQSSKPRASSKKEGISVKNNKQKAASKKPNNGSDPEPLPSEQDTLSINGNERSRRPKGSGATSQQGIQDYGFHLDSIGDDSDADVLKTPPLLRRRETPSYEPKPFPMDLSPRSGTRSMSPFDSPPPSRHGMNIPAETAQVDSASANGDEASSSDS
jgi:hypothetical protein